MKAFISDPTKNTPEIRFDPSSARFTIRGKSYPENSRQFYAPVLQWIRMNRFPASSVLELEFDYISSSSVIAILEMLKMIEETDKSVKVIWTYEAGDDDLMNVGMNYRKLCGLEFEFNELTE